MVDKFFIALAIVVVMWVIGDSIVRIIRASKSPGGKVKERIEAGPNPEEGLESFEGRKKIVEDNYASAQKDVEEIEAKLAELRG